MVHAGQGPDDWYLLFLIIYFKKVLRQSLALLLKGRASVIQNDICICTGDPEQQAPF